MRRGGHVHDLTSEQFTVWTLAHGSVDAVENEKPWRHDSVVELAKAAGVGDAAQLVDELRGAGVLADVSDPIEFAKTHRVAPLMLGLGNSGEDEALYGIGFFGQPLLQVTYPIYDLWQWCAMEDTLWGACESAADVAGRAGVTNDEYTDPERLLNGFIGSLHALLLANAVYIDIDFRLGRPV